MNTIIKDTIEDGNLVFDVCYIDYNGKRYKIPKPFHNCFFGSNPTKEMTIHNRFNDEYHVGFSSDCNGVGGPYALTPDHILLIGSGSQTMIGCGPKREAAEDKIRALEQSSRSQLTLTQLANSNIDNPSLPYYLLIQKMATGETLIWKNSALIDK